MTQRCHRAGKGLLSLGNQRCCDSKVLSMSGKLCLTARLVWAQASANSIILLAHHSSGDAGNSISTSHCECVLGALQVGESFCQGIVVWQVLLLGVIYPLFCDSTPLSGHNFCRVLLWCYLFLGAHNTWKLSPASQKRENLRYKSVLYVHKGAGKEQKIFLTSRMRFSSWLKCLNLGVFL